MIYLVMVAAILTLMTVAAVRSRRRRFGQMSLADEVRAAVGLPVIAKDTRQLRRAEARRSTWAEMRQHGGKLPVAPRRERRNKLRWSTWGPCKED